jgi:hypothetical protein
VGFLRDLELSSDDRCRQRLAVCLGTRSADLSTKSAPRPWRFARVRGRRPARAGQNPRSIIQPVIGTAEPRTASRTRAQVARDQAHDA